jgi:hypothetical protein
MRRREKAYHKKVQELMDKVGRLNDREVGRVMVILESARKDVAAAVASTEWQAYRIPQIKEAVATAIEAFGQQYLAGQSAAVANSWNVGIDAVDVPLQYAGIRPAAVEISREALEILQGYSADLIGGLKSDLFKKVNSEITLGIMGQKPQFEVMKAIGTSLEDKGIFKSIFHRAEAITRTETAKVQSMSRQARINAVVAGGTDPEMKWMKKWISSGKAHPRPTHEIDGEVVAVDEPFSNEILYPHAPGLPAAEVVNCG